MYRVLENAIRYQMAFSPHAWGCTVETREVSGNEPVFPTRVGMYRRWISQPRRNTRFPHTRGDVPHNHGRGEHHDQFSPHAWGCTDGNAKPFAVRNRFPHTRGDVPDVNIDHLQQTGVFPTRVGMYRVGA